MWAKINIKSDICKFSDKNLTNIKLLRKKTPLLMRIHVAERGKKRQDHDKEWRDYDIGDTTKQKARQPLSQEIGGSYLQQFFFPLHKLILFLFKSTY